MDEDSLHFSLYAIEELLLFISTIKIRKIPYQVKSYHPYVVRTGSKIRKRLQVFIPHNTNKDQNASLSRNVSIIVMKKAEPRNNRRRPHKSRESSRLLPESKWGNRHFFVTLKLSTQPNQEGPSTISNRAPPISPRRAGVVIENTSTGTSDVKCGSLSEESFTSITVDPAVAPPELRQPQLPSKTHFQQSSNEKTQESSFLNGQTSLISPFIAPFINGQDIIRKEPNSDNKKKDNNNENKNNNDQNSRGFNISDLDDIESGSDLEVIEVRSLHANSQVLQADPTYGETDTDSELSFLDEEINNALSSTTTTSTQASVLVSQKVQSFSHAALQKLLPSLCRYRAPLSPPPPGFRNIPPNLVNAIQRELNFFYDANSDDDIEVVGKMAFSLKDPIARTKIRLPIKATTCRHFECFDFYNFCLFYELSRGTINGLKSSMFVQSKESRETEDMFYKQQKEIAEGRLLIKSPGLVFPQFSEHGQMFFTDVYSRTPPLYKCPLCDEKFGLKQLYISDVFNFFVKTTPLHITKIELVENDRYKIIEEETIEKAEESHDVVDLDDEESRDSSGRVVGVSGIFDKANIAPGSSGTTPHSNRSINCEDFNDGLDDVLIRLGKGDGSWSYPLTLD